MGNDSPVTVLVNLVDSLMKGHTEHFLALHLWLPGGSLFSTGRNLADTVRSRKLRGRLKDRRAGVGNTALSLLSSVRMWRWRFIIWRI